MLCLETCFENMGTGFSCLEIPASGAKSCAFLTVKKKLFRRLTVNLNETLLLAGYRLSNPAAATFTLVDWWTSRNLVDGCRISLDLLYFTIFKPLLAPVLVIIFKKKPNKSIPSFNAFIDILSLVKILTCPFLISKLLSIL